MRSDNTSQWWTLVITQRATDVSKEFFFLFLFSNHEVTLTIHWENTIFSGFTVNYWYSLQQIKRDGNWDRKMLIGNSTRISKIVRWIKRRGASLLTPTVQGRREWWSVCCGNDVMWCASCIFMIHFHGKRWKHDHIQGPPKVHIEGWMWQCLFYFLFLFFPLPILQATSIGERALLIQKIMIITNFIVLKRYVI